MPPKRIVDVTVLIDDSCKDDLRQIANFLNGKGFVLSEMISSVGVLRGSICVDLLEDLSSIEEVASIEIDEPPASSNAELMY